MTEREKHDKTVRDVICLMYDADKDGMTDLMKGMGGIHEELLEQIRHGLIVPSLSVHQRAARTSTVAKPRKNHRPPLLSPAKKRRRS